MKSCEPGKTGSKVLKREASLPSHSVDLSASGINPLKSLSKMAPAGVAVPLPDPPPPPFEELPPFA